METTNTVLRAVRHETEERRDHLDIFREFLDHLGRRTRCASDDGKPNGRPAVTR
jgi:hypothetical protein